MGPNDSGSGLKFRLEGVIRLNTLAQHNSKEHCYNNNIIMMIETQVELIINLHVLHNN